MKTILAATIALGILTAPASAHRTSWYWSPSLMEKRLYLKYGDIEYVEDCFGYDRGIRGRGGVRLYKHFTCFVAYADDTEGELDVHVTGRRGLTAYE